MLYEHEINVWAVGHVFIFDSFESDFPNENLRGIFKRGIILTKNESQTIIKRLVCWTNKSSNRLLSFSDGITKIRTNENYIITITPGRIAKSNIYMNTYLYIYQISCQIVKIFQKMRRLYVI